MFRRWVAIGILFLVVGVVGAYSSAEAARWVYVPHNCAEWEPIEHADRTTAILETLGQHRGKAIYCGIDQSDTFAKAETWEAGREHNQRDDTTYWGDNGNFHGFTACQEGWLTEGESGLTGCGYHSIFEWPRERVRDRDDGGRVLYLKYGRTYHSGVSGGKYEVERERGRVVGPTSEPTSIVLGTKSVGAAYAWTPYVSGQNQPAGQGEQSKLDARDAFANSRYATLEGRKEVARDGSIVDTGPESLQMTSKAFSGADKECQELGYKKAQNITVEVAPDSTHNEERDYLRDLAGAGEGQVFRYGYRQLIYYEAVCWKP